MYGYKSEVPTPPSTGSINLLDWFTKQENIYQLDFRFTNSQMEEGHKEV